MLALKSLTTRRGSRTSVAAPICLYCLFCIGWLALFAPGAGAEQTKATTFQIQVSQPEYEGMGGVWLCGEAQFFHNECRGTVPLVMFGEPMRATIEIATRVNSTGRQKLFELRASLDGVRVKYKGRVHVSRSVGLALLADDGSFAGAMRLDQAEDTLAVSRPTPPEMFGLIIKRISSETDHK